MRGRAWPLLGAGALSAVAAVALVLGSTGPGPLRQAAPAPVEVGVVPAGPAAPSAREVAGAPTVPLVPVEVVIPAIGLRARVEDVAVARGGALGVPRDPAVVGWWAAGPRPGDPVGTAVLDSHVDYGPAPGAFARLSTLQPGAVVDVTGAGGTTTFVVAAVREYPKASLPWATVFDPTVRGRLALVTCGGAFDPADGHYRDNIVAYAVAT